MRSHRMRAQERRDRNYDREFPPQSGVVEVSHSGGGIANVKVYLEHGFISLDLREYMREEDRGLPEPERARRVRLRGREFMLHLRWKNRPDTPDANPISGDLLYDHDYLAHALVNERTGKIVVNYEAGSDEEPTPSPAGHAFETRVLEEPGA